MLATLTAQILTAPCGTRLDTGEGIELTIVGRDDIQPDGRARSVVLTSDGRYAEVAWHSGAEAEAAPVFVERWDGSGRAFHGWADAESRRLVQAG